MKIKDLLLNGSSFLVLMKQYAIDISDITIRDEEILSSQFSSNPQLSKESICIEGKNEDGVINFFGTLHYNILSKLAVFELQGLEKTMSREIN